MAEDAAGERFTNSDAIEQIRQLKARYFRFIDTQDWVGLRGLFVDDVTVDVRHDGMDIRTSADEFVTNVKAALRGVVSAHHGHMPEITLTGATTATGIWAMEDQLWFPEGSPVAHLHGYGHYHETYELVDGAWLITSMRLTRLRRDITPA